MISPGLANISTGRTSSPRSNHNGGNDNSTPPPLLHLSAVQPVKAPVPNQIKPPSVPSFGDKWVAGCLSFIWS